MTKRYMGWSDRVKGYADLDTRFSTYNTKAEGLIGDGVVDDRAALNTLVNVTMQPNGGQVDIIGTPRIASAITFPSNVTLNFVERAFLAPDNAIVVTINGQILPTQRKIFNTAGTFVFGATAKLPDIVPFWWGAIGDGVADDLVPLQKWHAAIPIEGTGVIPLGWFRFTAKLSWNGKKNIVGYGGGSALRPDLNDALTDGIVVNDTPDDLTPGNTLYRIFHRNFAILSPTANCCRNGIVYNRVFLATEINIDVKCACAQWGVLFNGILLCRDIRVVTSGNTGYPYASGFPVAGSVHVTRSVGANISSNANEITVLLEAGTASMRIEDQQQGGNNVIRGCIEGSTIAPPGRAFYAKGCLGISLDSLHMEANLAPLELDLCEAGVLDGGQQDVPAGGNAGKVILTYCKRMQIGALNADTLDVDPVSTTSVAGVAAGAARVITPVTMTLGNGTAIVAGTNLYCRNADGTNGEDITVTSVAGATFTADFASAKAANFWIGTRSQNIGLGAGAKISVINDPGNAVRNAGGGYPGFYAAVATGVPKALFDISTRGQGVYRVFAYIQNLGASYHALADFCWDGAGGSRRQGTDGALMTLTLVGNMVTATQSSGGNAGIAYNFTFTPT